MNIKKIESNYYDTRVKVKYSCCHNIGRFLFLVHCFDTINTFGTFLFSPVSNQEDNAHFIGIFRYTLLWSVDPFQLRAR